MTIVRFAYPGHGPKYRAYSGALSPIVSRVPSKVGVATRGDVDGPLFGRKIYDQAKEAFEFRWPVLSHEEARDIFRQWDDASGGSAPIYYTPDDQSEPIVVVMTAPPTLRYLSANTAAVTASVEEQR